MGISVFAHFAAATSLSVFTMRSYYPLTINFNARSNTVDDIAYISPRAFLSTGLFYSGMSGVTCMGGRLTARIALLFLSSRCYVSLLNFMKLAVSDI